MFSYQTFLYILILTGPQLCPQMSSLYLSTSRYRGSLGCTVHRETKYGIRMNQFRAQVVGSRIALLQDFDHYVDDNKGEVVVAGLTTGKTRKTQAALRMQSAKVPPEIQQLTMVDNKTQHKRSSPRAIHICLFTSVHQ